MYLLDTNVVSEARKKDRADPGVVAFFRQAVSQGTKLYLSSITVGELRRGIELIRHRGDLPQARLLEDWLQALLRDHADSILSLDADCAQVWGRLRVPRPENELDKQIAAIALVNDLTVVTRNVSHFASTGVTLFDPFAAPRAI